MPTAKSLEEFLSAPNNFTDLELQNQSIDDQSCIELAQALKINSTIKHINLSYNQIGDIGTIALSQALNEHIYSINFSHNQIGDEGVVALADKLKTNKHYFVSLSHNQIGDKGMIALANKLKTNEILSYLDISYNKIGDVGASSLEDNFPFYHLYLNNNYIGNKGAISLAEGLKHLDIKYQAFVLLLNDNQIEKEGAIALIEALKDKEVFGSYKFQLQLKNNPINFSTIKYFETIQWKKNVQIDYSKKQFSDLEMSSDLEILQKAFRDGELKGKLKGEIKGEIKEAKKGFIKFKIEPEKMVEELEFKFLKTDHVSYIKDHLADTESVIGDTLHLFDMDIEY
jgi:hypothetical protein